MAIKLGEFILQIFKIIQLNQWVMNKSGSTKEFAGRQVLVESPAKGVWIIRTATIIPDHEKWTDSSSSPKSLGKQRTAKTEI
jgi:hypothetical protein